MIGSCDLFFPRLENGKQTIFKAWPDRKAICAQWVLYLGMIHMKIRIGVNVGKDISESARVKVTDYWCES